MQKEGKPSFLKHHNKSVRGVAFSPRDRYLFCSGSYDGNINFYSSLSMELLMSYAVTTMAITDSVNAVRFTSDGSRILACTITQRLSVVDVERGQELLVYDNCTASGRDRTALATDPTSPNIAVSVAVNGKGLTLLDLRMPLPLDYVYDLHSSTIRDIIFLESSWPWAGNGLVSTLVTASTDGCCKVCTMDGRVVHTFYCGQQLNTVCQTPEPFQGYSSNGFYSVVMTGGQNITSYIPDLGVQESFCENLKPIWKMRYTSNGGFLYSVCEGGVVRKYRRYPNRHDYLGEMYTHEGHIQDLDISPYDDYLITASKDKTVGVLCLGAPSHGYSDYGSEFT